MSSVMVLCPVAARPVYTGIEMDETTSAGLPELISRISCSACGGEHLWRVRKACWPTRGGKCRPTELIPVCASEWWHSSVAAPVFVWLRDQLTLIP
jgi:hypothetical protein